jgi:hypothetical protein
MTNRQYISKSFPEATTPIIQFNKYNKFYSNARLFGSGKIIRDYLSLPDTDSLPLTVPHGIDYYHWRLDIDSSNFEPIYLACREDIAQRVEVFKTALRFPHPWLLLTDKYEPPEGCGTLFIAPPPSSSNFSHLYEKILEGEYPLPWGILIKERGIEPQHFDWWESKGFCIHSAGSIEDQAFFYNLRDIFARYKSVASPNMSSAVILAVSMGRLARAIYDVEISAVDVPNAADAVYLDDRNGMISNTWFDLLSTDRGVALRCANSLLGACYMDSKDVLRDRYFEALSRVKSPLCLYPLRAGTLCRLTCLLIGWGVPVQKFFPNPISKVISGLAKLLGFNRLSVIVGSDFAHYGIGGNCKKFEIKKVFVFQLGRSVEPGQALRM